VPPPKDSWIISPGLISLIASLSFITPFVTLVFIMIFLGEKITVIQIAGLLIILLGTGVQSMGSFLKKKKAAPIAAINASEEFRQ
jgi:drug/metabolite transporter (DMT)-like permease